MCDAAERSVIFANRAAETPLTEADIDGVLAGLASPIDRAQFEFCKEHNQSSTRMSMLFLTVLYALAGIFFAFSARGLKRDMEA